MKPDILMLPYLEYSENLNQFTEEDLNAQNWFQDKVFAFLQKKGQHDGIFQKHLTYNKNVNKPGIIQNGMLMIPKKFGWVDDAVEYHHMDQLEFMYYHADEKCAFKNVLCKSEHCIMYKMLAFSEHL